MCKRAGLLVGWDYGAKRALITHANCDAWECPECAQRMKQRWLMRAEMGARRIINDYDFLDFVTLTSHEKNRSFESSYRVWREAWPVLYAALYRQRTGFQFMIIPEQHLDKTLHFHCLWNAGKAERWLKDNARERGLGYILDVQAVCEPVHAVRYVTKYVGKSLGDNVPARFRRVRTSQAWPDIPDPNTMLSGLRWEYLREFSAVAAVMRECQAKRFALIDIETGENFETVDLPAFLQPIDT